MKILVWNYIEVSHYISFFWGHYSLNSSHVTSDRKINPNVCTVQVFLFLTFLRATLYQHWKTLDTLWSPETVNGSHAICLKMSHFPPKPSSVCKTHSTVFGDRSVSCFGTVFQVVLSEQSTRAVTIPQYAVVSRPTHSQPQTLYQVSHLICVYPSSG